MLWVGAWSSEEPLPVSLPIPLQWMFIGQSRLFFVISRSLRLVAAFWCYLKSTEYVIPSITAILGSFEPLSAVVLSVIILGATFNSYELLGAAAILANMLILAWPSKDTKSLAAN